MFVLTALLALAAGVALSLDPLWRWTVVHVITMVHEAGHAVAALLTQYGRVGRIELFTHAGARRRGGTAGVTWTATISHRAQVFVAAAGYPAPAGLGLAVLALTYHHHGTGALAALVASLAVMLLVTRTLFGVFLIVTTGAFLYLTFLYAPAGVQTLVLGTFAWALLAGAARDTIALLRHIGTDPGSDATDLGTMTTFRAEHWAALFVLATATAAGFAGWITLAAVTPWI